MEVDTSAGRLALGSPKQRALLAMLALNPNRLVGVDTLMDGLWGEQRPDDPDGSLRFHVTRLRKALGPDRHVVVTRPGGYQLVVADDDVDVVRFEKLLTAAATSPARVAVLEQALGVWRGPALADLATEPFALPQIRRLEELRASAEEDVIAAHLDSGRGQAVVADLERLVVEQPLRERRWELLMLALYRAGRQAEALEAYQRLRTHLVESLGIEPSLRLSQLESRVLCQAPDLGADPELESQPTMPVAPPAPVIPPTPTNLPVTESLIGRDVDLAAVATLVRGRRLVTITGPGGVGKSRLALAAARTTTSDLPAGAWLVELAPVADASGILGAITGAVPLPNMVTTAAELAAQTGERRMLVVLDNCEHLIDDVASLVSTWLRSCSGLHLLCTSQVALDVDGEHVWPLQPLGPDAATALFNERARAVSPGIVADPVTVSAIVDRLDGVPLAIELAAARVVTFSPQEIATRLDDRFRFLRGVRRDTPNRHHGLRALVEWSHDLLDADQQRTFRRLAVFAGGFTAEAAARVAGSASEDRDWMEDQLDLLVRRSLVVAEPGSGQTRYRLLETLRQYGFERLVAAGELDVARRRHADWCVDHATGLERCALSDEAGYLSRGQAELDNFGAAVTWAVERRDSDLAVRLVARLWRLYFLWRSELLDWARQVLTLPGADNHPDAGYVHLIVAHLAWPLGRIDESEHASSEALRHPLEEDAWWSAASVYSDMLFYQGRFEECTALAATASDRLTTAPNRIILQAKSLAGEAFGLRPRGIDPAQLITDADATGVQWVRCVSRQGAALALASRGRPAEALAVVQEALEIVRPGLNRLAVGLLNEALALIIGGDANKSEDDDLAERAARARQLKQEYPFSLSFSLVGLVRSAERIGRIDDAALIAGYIAANLTALGLPGVSADVMAGGPLDRFDTTATGEWFTRGKSLTSAELDDVLQRLSAPRSDPRPSTIH